MIKILEDRSYLSKRDNLFIQEGLAKLSIHSIHIDRYWTKEEMDANYNEVKNLTKEAWSKRCEESKNYTASLIEKVMDTLSESFKVYQYKDKSIKFSDDYDLFFWCNCGDLSHITLNPNEKRDLNTQLSDIDKTIDLINTMELDIIDKLVLRIQYSVDYNKYLIKNIAEKYFNKIKDDFIEFNGYIGRVKKEICRNGHTEYRFYKKGAKKKYYSVSDVELCHLYLL